MLTARVYNTIYYIKPNLKPNLKQLLELLLDLMAVEAVDLFDCIVYSVEVVEEYTVEAVEAVEVYSV